MNPAVLSPVISLACVVVTVAYLYRLRRAKPVYILDYQAGLRFRDGTICSVLQHGGQFLDRGRDPITVIDMRPHQFVLERIGYQDALFARSVISVGGELVVRNPQLAVGTLKDIVNDSLALVRDSLRLSASRMIADPSPEGRARLNTAITADVNSALQPRGVEIQNLEITELWAHLNVNSMSGEAN